MSWRITPRLRRLCCCFLPKAPITRLNAPSSLIFMRAIRPPVASITRLTASNDTGACEIYETARTDFAHLCAIRHFSSLYSLLPLYPAIGLFCIPSWRLSNLLFNVRICWEIFFGSDENARSSFSFPPLLFETIKISRIESLMEDRRVFFSSSFPFFSSSYFASFRSCGRNGH